MRLIVYGSLVYDRIMDFPGYFKDFILPKQIHKLSVSFTVKEFHETFGGAGGNIAYNLTLLGTRPILYGTVGRDFSKYQEHFNSINLTGIKKYPEDLTASAYIITDKNNNQITGFFPGAMRFHAQPPKLRKNDLVIIAPGNPNEMLDFADSCYLKVVPFIFDPGQQIIQFTKRQLKRAIKQAAIYIVNDYELSLTQKITGYNKVDLLSNAGVLITTLGNKGSLIEIKIKNNQQSIQIKPATVKKVVDPTGAGDAYRAGIIKGITLFKKTFLKKQYLKLPWQKIGQFGSLAAVYALENYGTQNHYYNLEKFKKRYQLTYQEKYD